MTEEKPKKKFDAGGIGLVIAGVILGLFLSVVINVVTRPNTPQVPAVVAETINPGDALKIVPVPPSGLKFLVDQGFLDIRLQATASQGNRFQANKEGSHYDGILKLTNTGEWAVEYTDIRPIGK